MTASLRYLWLGFLAAVIIFADSVIKTKKLEKFCNQSEIFQTLCEMTLSVCGNRMSDVKDCDWRSDLRENFNVEEMRSAMSNQSCELS